MAEDNTIKRLGPLYAEHLLLGASFEDGTRVLRYESESLDAPSLMNATYLCDLTYARLTLLSGQDSPALAQAAFAGRKLEVGECRYEPALTGDGGIASIALLARTGQNEYVMLDTSPRAEVLHAWLAFLSSISQDGYEPYAHADVQDVSASHVLLLLGGKDATAVLLDYVGDQPLPGKGCVAPCRLDRIPAIVLRLPTASQPCYLIMAPPHTAVALWRSFLSFTEVIPVGNATINELLVSEFPWMDYLTSTDAVRLSSKALMGHDLLRKDQDYVGARALFG